jgi:hypothetical protein
LPLIAATPAVKRSSTAADLRESSLRMAGTFRDKVKQTALTLAGRDSVGGPAIPRTGTDTASKRQFLALFIVTIVIMVVGLTIALSIDEPDTVTPTPTVVVMATATAVG